MLSADQIPVKSTHSRDALARVGCPDSRINRHSHYVAVALPIWLARCMRAISCGLESCPRRLLLQLRDPLLEVRSPQPQQFALAEYDDVAKPANPRDCCPQDRRSVKSRLDSLRPSATVQTPANCNTIPAERTRSGSSAVIQIFSRRGTDRVSRRIEPRSRSTATPVCRREASPST
jgi:hypothetical protein